MQLKYKQSSFLWLSTFCVALLSPFQSDASLSIKRFNCIDSLKIADVWSGHPVDFALVQRGDSQYIAFYNSERKMSVAVRSLIDNKLHIVNLPSTIEWDSHNYIALAIDSMGFIHVSGNMHSSPLVYFRSTVPWNIDSLKSAAMVGSLESSVTYPVFFNGPSGELLYMYRDGSSGNGNQIFNKWNTSTKKWTRFFDRALFDGQGARNAYMGGPILGPDGYYHVYWMWRETADASTTHDVGYIKSKDLLNWESASGNKLTLPITASTSGVLVDAIPQHGGVINRGAIGFDSKKRVIITYHKFDASGNTQLYNARFEGTQWKIYKASNWAYRWDFGGTGSLVMNITFGPVMLESGNTLTQSYYHVKYGTGMWQLDESTLQPTADLGTSLWPSTMEQSRQSGMVVHWLRSCGLISMAGTFLNSTSSPPKDSSIVYALRWETMPENKDQPRTPVPAPTSLVLYTFKDLNVATGITKMPVPKATQKQMFKLYDRVLIKKEFDNVEYAVTVCDMLGKTIVSKMIYNNQQVDLKSVSGHGALIVNVAAGRNIVYRGLLVDPD